MTIPSRAILIGALLFGLAASAQEPPQPVRVRGTIQSFDGQKLALATKSDGVVQLAVSAETDREPDDADEDEGAGARNVPRREAQVVANHGSVPSGDRSENCSGNGGRWKHCDARETADVSGNIAVRSNSSLAEATPPH